MTYYSLDLLSFYFFLWIVFKQLGSDQNWGGGWWLEGMVQLSWNLAVSHLHLQRWLQATCNFSHYALCDTLVVFNTDISALLLLIPSFSPRVLKNTIAKITPGDITTLYKEHQWATRKALWLHSSKSCSRGSYSLLCKMLGALFVPLHSFTAQVLWSFQVITSPGTRGPSTSKGHATHLRQCLGCIDTHFKGSGAISCFWPHDWDHVITIIKEPHLRILSKWPTQAQVHMVGNS